MGSSSIAQFGRYRILGEVASGGMATVYRASLEGASGFEKQVALKVMHPHLAKDQHHRAMFEEEARTGALLHHRSIIETLDYGEEEGKPYLATEFLDGMSLDKALDKRKKLPPELAAWILLELLDALAYAHELRDEKGKPLGIVHRDISPHNIFLTRDGRVKLIDFGIALREGRKEQTEAGLVKGKFRYMAPEQARGRAVDGRADNYSLALVYVTAVSGRKPHEGAADTREMIVRAQEGFRPSAGALRDLPEELADLVEELLSPEAKKRPDAEAGFRRLQDLVAAHHPAAGSRTVRDWMELVDPAPKPKRKARKKKVEPAPAPALPPTPEDGIHPAWVFLVLAGLFGVSLLLSVLGA